MAITSLELVKAISIVGISNGIRVWGMIPHVGEAKAWIVARTPPDQAGDTMKFIDFATGQVTNIVTDGDFGFKVPLYFYRRKVDETLVIERIAGFGQYQWTGEPTASIIFKFKDDGSYVKQYNTHTDVGNPNNDNNLDKCLYIPSVKKLLCSTAQGGRHIWIIDIETLQYERVGRILSTLDLPFGYHVGILSGDNRIYFIGGTHNTANMNNNNPFIVCSVELDDIIENLSNDIGLDQLGTYQEIYRDSARGIYDAPAAMTTFGKKTIVRTIDTSGVVRYTMIDFVNGSVQDLTITPPDGAVTGSYVFRILGYWAVIDNNGIIHVLDINMTEVMTVQIPNWSNYQYQNQPTIGSWLNGIIIGYDNVGNVIDIYYLKVNGVIPKLIVDTTNKIVRVVDILTGNPIANAVVQISNSRAGNPLDEPVDVTPVQRTTDTNGEVSFSDIVTPNGFISIQLVEV